MNGNRNSRPLRFSDSSSRLQFQFMRNRRERFLAASTNEIHEVMDYNYSENNFQVELSNSSVNNENEGMVTSNSPAANSPINDVQDSGSESEEISVDNEESNFSDDEPDDPFLDSEHINNVESNFGNFQSMNDLDEDPLLYPNAPITQGESMLAILSFSIRHNLTGVASEDLLKLISFHCIKPNRCKSSSFLFKKYFSHMYTTTSGRHFYCSLCLRSLKEDERCAQCSLNTKVNCFVEMSITDQLETLYRRDGFIDNLKHRETRIKINSSNYEDIYDGRIYQELYEQSSNITENEHKLSFTWNCDGVSLFKSSRFQIWPFYLAINELPYSERFKKGNLLLAGLWFGSKKPLPPLFLRSISSELVKLKDGIFLDVPNHNPSVIKIYINVICGTCDLPAKALFLNMKQYNGKNGCQKCKIETVPIDNRSTVRFYPYRVNVPLRTQEETNEFAEQAAEFDNFDICGVKGPSAIVPFVPNYIRCTSVDVMHCVYLGVVKSLLTLWFTSEFSGENWSLHEYIDVVNKNLCSIKPPEFIVRMPRSISDHLQYFKASELKSWFFYYSLPLLYSIMDEIYFDHYKLLVHAIYLLNQKSIFPEQVNYAEDLLSEFVSRFSDLYSDRHMTSNLHHLLHLSETVRDFGPLWVSSCFSYENANGDLRNLVTGTRFAELQICSGVSLYMNLPNLKSRLLTPNTPIYNFCEHLETKKAKYKLEKISRKIYVVGLFIKMDSVPEIVDVTLHEMNIDYNDIQIFLRLMKNGFLYTSELYCRSKKTNSMYVKFSYDGEIYRGVIHCFVQISNCSCESEMCECSLQYYAIIKVCDVIPCFYPMPDNNFTYLYECNITDRMLAINVENLICVCVHVKMPLQSVEYIVDPVNLIEIE